MENTVQWLANTAWWAVINRVNSTLVNNSNVILDVGRYFSSLLAALFYSTHLLEGSQEI